MAKPRERSGKWELALRHPLLPGGRKYFTFDTEAEALAYDAKWRAMKRAGLPPPAEMLEAPPDALPMLGVVIRAYANSGLAAPTAASPLGSLMTEVGGVPMSQATYSWLSAYVQRLKTINNLAPNTIRHRVQALGRAIDEWLRHNPKVTFQNPVKLLPRGYSSYSEVDAKLAKANDGKVKEDVTRERRLQPGEEARIVAALSGVCRPDRERSLELRGDDALLTMFRLIVGTGLRLKEAYTLTRGQVDFDAKVIRAQSSKQRRGKVVFRDVPMRPEVHACLTDYLGKRPGLLPSAYLFPFMDEDAGASVVDVGKRLSGRFRVAFDYAGCVDLREHDLRHEATCRWLELRDKQGRWIFRLEELNRIMGWAPGSLMAMRYASFRPSDLAQRVWDVMQQAEPGQSSGAA